MRIGILGTGMVGKTLGAGFITQGHEVRLGTRDPRSERVSTWLAQNGGRASAGTFDQAASFGDLLVLATQWGGVENAIRLAEPRNFSRKIVIDVTNPLVFFPNEAPRLALGQTDSGGEQVQRWLPGAMVVKAFNTVGNSQMVNPSFPEGRPDMFICGDNEAAKKEVEKIIAGFGWGVVDLGDISISRYLEPMAMVWILYYFKTQTVNHAFKLLRK